MFAGELSKTQISRECSSNDEDDCQNGLREDNSNDDDDQVLESHYVNESSNLKLSTILEESKTCSNFKNPIMESG